MKVPFRLAGLLAVPLALLAMPAAKAGPYAGLDLNATSLNLNSSASQLTPQTTGGFGIRVGERLGAFAAELGYGITTKSGNPDLNSLRLNKLTVDGLYYVPVMGALKLIVTGGGSQVNYGSSSYSFVQTGNGDNARRSDKWVFGGSEFDWRAGGGFSIAFSDNFDVRIIGRYEPVKMRGLGSYALSLDSGFDFYF